MDAAPGVPTAAKDWLLQVARIAHSGISGIDKQRFSAAQLRHPEAICCRLSEPLEETRPLEGVGSAEINSPSYICKPKKRYLSIWFSRQGLAAGCYSCQLWLPPCLRRQPNCCEPVASMSSTPQAQYWHSSTRIPVLLTPLLTLHGL